MAKQMGYTEALSARPRKPTSKEPAKLRSIEFSKAENGGHIAEHRFESGDGSYHSPEQHVFGADEGHKLLAHVAKHMGIQAEEPETEETHEAEEGEAD